MFIIAHAVREMCFVSVYLNNFKLHQFFVCLFFLFKNTLKKNICILYSRVDVIHLSYSVRCGQAHQNILS